MKQNGDLVSPTGKVEGAPGGIPSRGVTTGVTDTYGADLTGDATNRMGSMSGATKSDPAEQCFSKSQQGMA